jgi:FMN phosphatase YigB (HAD superfamily)
MACRVPPLPDPGSIELVLYDLDGTLYENTDQYEHYTSCLASRLEGDARRRFLEEYHAVQQGRHRLSYGLTFDVSRRLLLRTSQSSPARVIEAWSWDGHAIDPGVVYGDAPVAHDLESFITASDPWWIPHILAHYHGLSILQCEQAFLEARRMMMAPSYNYRPARGVPDGIRECALRYLQVLATNAPRAEAERILQATGTLGLFDLQVFEAGKPQKMRALIREVSHEFRVPFERILSVGDNPFNEIYPALALNCKTCLVDPAGCYRDRPLAGPRVDSLQVLLQYLARKEPFRKEPARPPDQALSPQE